MVETRKINKKNNKEQPISKRTKTLTKPISFWDVALKFIYPNHYNV